ncbi:sigma-70 family RNA polymerase sigma factor [Streptacidiphilus sp. N1-3]|uniref:Sigma-70 family RNA polymerase sigma factor n=1 Tax=Streptacidiphilus alkalitolerans TaxID=3342712 RepID=A0ABV6X7S4_9ACTN
MRVDGQDDDRGADGPETGVAPEAGAVPEARDAPAAETVAEPLPHIPAQGPRHRAGPRPEPGAGPETVPVNTTDVTNATVPAPGGPVDDEELPASDTALTAAVRAGDDSAFEELYRRHADAVRRYARTCCRDAFTAEDLAGEVFARTLQALRAGKGPEFAVRAYLLTAVRNIAATWSRSDRREQLVDDFTLFAATSAVVADVSTTDPGADAWAMAGVDHSLVLRAFSKLEPSDQVLLWHTEVQQEPPREVAAIIGKTANATAVQAHRARDRLATEFLQAHISDSQQTACEEHARKLGAFARGSLGKRASGDIREHMQECDRCSAAYLELVDLNHSLRELLPTGVLVWIGSGYFTVLAAGAAGAAGLGVGVGVAASGTAAGGTAAGAAAGTAAGGSGGGAAGGAAASEGLGLPAKAGIAAVVTVVAVAGVVFALSGSEHKPPPPKPQAAKVVPSPAAIVPPPPPAPSVAPVPPPPAPVVHPKPRPTVRHTPAPKPTVRHTPAPKPKPTPPKPTPTPPPPPAPADYYVDALPYSGVGSPTGPSLDGGVSSWVWQRSRGVRVGGQSYGRGITVHAPSSVTVQLNRQCREFDAEAGIDDMTLGFGAARFTVLDATTGRTLWRSGVVRGGEPAVPVSVPLTGVTAIRLVATPARDGLFGAAVNVADWANARFSCS